MATERVGYRRLYDAMGCSLAEREEFDLSFSFSHELGAELYLGPHTRYGVSIDQQGDKYLVPGETNLIIKSEFHKDAALSPYPRKFFLEILTWKAVQVSEELSIAFRGKKDQSHNQLLKLAHENSETLKAAADLIAGIIGLRFHPQFVLNLINEGFVALRPGDDTAYEFISPSLRVLDPLALNERGVDMLSKHFLVFSKAEERARSDASIVLSWLLRAWIAPDPVTKFISLFIPIEIVIGEEASNAETKQRIDALRRLIVSHSGTERDELLRFLDSLAGQYRPGLPSRFERLARKAAFPGWEADVAAFRKFNAMRNDLMHRGEEQVQLRITVAEEDVRDLEDLVERYISYSLFGDGIVYQSRWRPARR